MVMKTMQQLMTDGGKCIWVAPSGGRDRPSDDGKYEVAPFDSKSIEMFRLMSAKADGTATSGPPRGHLEPSRVISSHLEPSAPGGPADALLPPLHVHLPDLPAANHRRRRHWRAAFSCSDRLLCPGGILRPARAVSRAGEQRTVKYYPAALHFGEEVDVSRFSEGCVTDNFPAGCDAAAPRARDPPRLPEMSRGWPEIGELVARRAARGDTF